MSLSFTIAAGPRLGSYSQVRVPWDSWSYFTVSDSRFPKPEGSGPRMYIPQEWGGVAIPPDTGLPFRGLLRLAGLQWSYSYPPPHEIWSELWVWVLYYDRLLVGQSVLELSSHLGLTTKLLLLSDSCGFVDVGLPLSDERVGLSFTIAAGSRQRSHSRVPVPWDSWPYFTVSDSRFRFSSPTTRRATVEIFDLASTWAWTLNSQSQRLMTRYLLLFDSYGLVFVGHPLGQEDGSDFLHLLLAIASVVFLGSESLRARDPILLDLRLPFSSPPTTRRLTVEVFNPASKRRILTQYCSLI
jgi:hypothetical protein